MQSVPQSGSTKTLIFMGLFWLAMTSANAADAVSSTPEQAPKQGSSVPKGTYIQQTAQTDDGSHVQISPTVDLADDIKLLKSIDVPGWDAQPAMGLINSQNNLVGHEDKPFDEIGGKPAAILVEYGCIDVATRIYKRGQRQLHVNLFHFKTDDGAFGAYSTMREGSSTVIRRGQGSSEDERSISFFAGKYMAFLSNPNEDDDEAKEALGKLADKLAQVLPNGAEKQPLMIASLPHFERLKGSEKYFMGSKSANHYATAPFLDSLQLDQSKGAAYADYTYSRPMAERLKLLLTEYSTPSLAQSAFSAYTASMASLSRKTVSRGSNELICKMSDSYLMCGMNGPRVYVISGARKANSPNILARELRFQ